MIKFQFSEEKTTQAAALFLKCAGGKMNYMKLIKLLYLADRKALEKWERPITGDSYISMRHGPVLSNVLDFISNEDDPDNPSFWSAFIKQSGYDVELSGEPQDGELSQREIDLINDIFRQYKDMNKWALVKYLHETLPEWEDPDCTSIPIRVEDILKALGKTELDINIINDEVGTHAFAKKIFAS